MSLTRIPSSTRPEAEEPEIDGELVVYRRRRYIGQPAVATAQIARAAASAPAVDSAGEPVAEPVAETVAAGDGEDVSAPNSSGQDEAPPTIGRGRRRGRQEVTEDEPGDEQAA
jgi:hypothetical protein